MKRLLRLFLCGDVMTGRGIDQILPHPSDPRIFEPYVEDARVYVKLAERASGAIPSPADFDYPWGDAVSVWEKMAPDLRLINLETSITTSEDYWRGKGINYRMHPKNIPCITAAGIDACALANNHVIDWGYSGLHETLATLRSARLKTAGAGGNELEAAAPAELVAPGKRRVLLFSFGLSSSGIPEEWAATANKAGVNLLRDLSDHTVATVAAQVNSKKAAGDVVIASIHWGDNWGFEISAEERRFAHRLLDFAGVDIVHGHSSHHVKGIEVYRGKLVLYGCGDFLNDYEGIRGYEAFRGDLALMYFVDVDLATGTLTRLTMVPMRTRNFRLQLAAAADKEWMEDTLNRQGRIFGTSVSMIEDGELSLRWSE